MVVNLKTEAIKNTTDYKIRAGNKCSELYCHKIIYLYCSHAQLEQNHPEE